MGEAATILFFVLLFAAIGSTAGFIFLMVEEKIRAREEREREIQRAIQALIEDGRNHKGDQ